MRPCPLSVCYPAILHVQPGGCVLKKGEIQPFISSHLIKLMKNKVIKKIKVFIRMEKMLGKVGFGKFHGCQGRRTDGNHLVLIDCSVRNSSRGGSSCEWGADKNA